MAKQEKVLKKIKHSINCGQTTPLGTKPNDECYTSLDDILSELSYWGNLGKFKGKNIICPCDWDIVEEQNIYSISITYTETGIDAKQKIQIKYDEWADTLWASDTEETKIQIQPITLKEDQVEDFLRNKLTCNFVRALTQNARRWGIKSITASGYNPATGKGIKFQDVDYSKYDLCITNPPFSLYADFMKCIIDKIDFICLAPFLNRVTPNIGLPLMLKKAYLGKNCGIPDMKFNNPTSSNNYHTKTIAVDWITSFSEAQDERNEALKNKHTNIRYEDYAEDYMVMENMTMKDGTHPIRVATTQIPCDYDGWMFGSVQFLQLYDLRQYEWYGTNFKGYYNKQNPEANPFNHPCTDSMLDNPGMKRMFHGIVFRKKPDA